MRRLTRDRYSQRGTPPSPDKLAGKQRPDDRGDDHDRTRNAHSPQQHHAPSTFAIEKTTLPTRASPITEATFPSPGSVPKRGSRTRSGFRGQRRPRRERATWRLLPTAEKKVKAVDGPSIPTYKKSAAARYPGS